MSLLSKFSKQSIEVGSAFQLSGAHDRQQHIEQTLERLKKVRIKEAEVECQRLLDNARQEAQDIIQLAHQKAATIVQEGESQVEIVLKQAYEEGENAGFTKGKETGLQQAEVETFHLLTSAQLLLNGAYDAQQKILKGFKIDALELITHVTQKVLQQELAQQPEALLHIIDTAVENLHLSGKIKVLISTETLNILNEYSTETQEALGRLNRFQLEADPLLDGYEIFILAEEGNFVLSPENQAKTLIQPLAKHLELPEISVDEVNQPLENLPEPRQIEAPSLEAKLETDEPPPLPDEEV